MPQHGARVVIAGFEWTLQGCQGVYQSVRTAERSAEQGDAVQIIDRIQLDLQRSFVVSCFHALPSRRQTVHQCSRFACLHE